MTSKEPNQMLSYTPGPWHWSDGYRASDGRRTWSLVSEKTGYGILSCDGVANSPQGLCDPGNADLIASAPTLLAQRDQLLKALESAVIAVEQLCVDQDPANECHNVLRTARAAVEKAKEPT